MAPIGAAMLTGAHSADRENPGDTKEFALMCRLGRFAFFLLLLIGAQAASAATDTYKITAKEKAACTTDAIRFCAYTYPDESALMSCMKSNRSSLSAICLAAFDAGMKRRHLN